MKKTLQQINYHLKRRLFPDPVRTDYHHLFFHKPGGAPSNGMVTTVNQDFARLRKHILKNKAGKKYTFKRNDLIFLTYSNYKEKQLIEKCYDNYGITNYKTVAKDYFPWDWIGKVKPALDYLQSTEATSIEYVVATDGNDMLLINDPNDIIDRFQQYNCDLLFCNTVADWPPNEDCRVFELSKYYTYPFHAHLSAGGYVGKKAFIIQCLEELLDSHKRGETWMLHKGKFDDQLGWRYLHKKYHPRIRVDYKKQIFNRFDLFMNLK